MFPFLEKIFSWKPFAGSGEKTRHSSRHHERFNAAHDLARDRRPPVPRREAIIAVLAGMNLSLLPWLIAGQPLWTQWFSLTFSSLAFAFLFLPVGYDEWRSATAAKSFRDLTKCIPFWCGLFLMALFALQGLNPRYSVELDGGFWQLLPEDYVHWLPSGVLAPMITRGEPGGMNAWRTMLVFAPMWLTFSALHTGVRSRRVVKWLIRSVLGSCVLLAIFAMGMRTAGDAMLYNQISVKVGSVYGPFLYQNQGGAFFYLAFLLAAAVAFREWRASAGMSLRGGAHFVMGSAAVLLAGGAAFSASFAAVACLAAGAVVLIPAWWLARPKVEGSGGLASWAGALIALVLVGSLFAGVLIFSDMEPVWQKVMHKFNLAQSAKLDDRESMRDATWMMFKENSTAFGSGAGSYRWLSPEYFARIPEFRSKTTGMLLSRANYAHFDWLQMLTEWGVVGMLAVVGMLGWGVRRLWTERIWAKPVVWPIVAGLLLIVAHACMDYLFFNPALNLMAAFLAFVGLVWVRESKA